MYPQPLAAEDESDATTIQRLRETLGEFFADRLSGDRDWAMGVLQGSQ